ncbi:MAG: hypothetical protein Wins2KO_04230 [Winogradskyella sp.]
MKRSTKGWLMTALIVGLTMVIAAWNSQGITKFVDEKLPFLSKFKSKVTK